MASKKTLNAQNLQVLGVQKLSELLIELSAGDNAMKRRLRMELAGAESPHALAKEIRKRLVSIARSKSFVDWHGIRELENDLETQRAAIVDKVAKEDPNEALELLWQFMGLAPSIVERSHDRSGVLIAVFHETCKDLGKVALEAKTDVAALADKVYDALIASDYTQYDNLIQIMAPALGQAGLEQLKQRIIDLSNTPVERPAEEDRVNIGWSLSKPIYDDEIKERSRVSTVRSALKDIADVQGDVDSFIAQHDEETRKAPRIAAEITRRLLEAGRAEEALATLEAASDQRSGNWNWPDFTWEDARIDTLEALGRSEEAQQARCSCFERSLSSTHLRDYLKKLPDFDDIEAEEKALDYALTYPSRLESISFLVSWPSLDRAARLVIENADHLNGDEYVILNRVANGLAGKHPLAATLALRSMINFTLTEARSSRYKHAARHLLDCSGLSSDIKDYGSFETHDAYEARLRRDHARKSSFWKNVG